MHPWKSDESKLYASNQIFKTLRKIGIFQQEVSKSTSRQKSVSIKTGSLENTNEGLGRQNA